MCAIFYFPMHLQDMPLVAAVLYQFKCEMSLLHYDAYEHLLWVAGADHPAVCTLHVL